MLVDNDPVRSAIVEEYLSENGYQVVQRLDSTSDLACQIENIKPDVIVVDIDSPDRDTLEDVHLASKDAPRPIVLFTDDSNKNTMDKAMKAGISAYVVDGLSKSRIKPVIEVAVARFEEYQSLKSELNEAKSKLADRKDIDIAKALLQKEHNMSEDRAYKALRKIAMDQKITIGAASRNLISISKIIQS
tara:strand:- start:144522 stop:145088 length:567 start_codon:yes stop_codon:yes gene_type:complete